MTHAASRSPVVIVVTVFNPPRVQHTGKPNAGRPAEAESCAPSVFSITAAASSPCHADGRKSTFTVHATGNCRLVRVAATRSQPALKSDHRPSPRAFRNRRPTKSPCHTTTHRLWSNNKPNGKHRENIHQQVRRSKQLRMRSYRTPAATPKGQVVTLALRLRSND
jgi:hypothetical protein